MRRSRHRRLAHPDRRERHGRDDFTFDASALAGKSVVVFERLYDGERLVAAHADIDGANQTVEVYALPHTGDATDLASASWATAAGMAMATIGAYLAHVRKEQSL